jgi:hypothetical protein
MNRLCLPFLRWSPRNTYSATNFDNKWGSLLATKYHDDGKVFELWCNELKYYLVKNQENMIQNPP